MRLSLWCGVRRRPPPDTIRPCSRAHPGRPISTAMVCPTTAVGDEAPAARAASTARERRHHPQRSTRRRSRWDLPVYPRRRRVRRSTAATARSLQRADRRTPTRRPHLRRSTADSACQRPNACRRVQSENDTTDFRGFTWSSMRQVYFHEDDLEDAVAAISTWGLSWNDSSTGTHAFWVRSKPSTTCRSSSHPSTAPPPPRSCFRC